MFFENQANDQEHLYNQLCRNIQFSTRSVNTQQNQITYSKILNNNRQPFWVHSISHSVWSA